MDRSRNWLFIDEKLQAELAQTRVLFLGLGLGSAAAECALRTGFTQLIVCDGDAIEETNLNRQNYVAADCGRNKAEVCATRLQAIDPSAKISVRPYFAQEARLAEEIAAADLIVNTIDFDDPAFAESSRAVQAAGKIEIFPMNLGFGTALTVFRRDSGAWPRALSADSIKDELLSALAQNTAIAPYLREAAARYAAGEKRAYDPQTAISTQLAAGLITRTLIRCVAGEEDLVFPHFRYIDTEEVTIPLEIRLRA